MSARASHELRGLRAADALVWLIFKADALADKFRTGVQA